MNKTRANWNKVKLAYQRGDGSIRQLAEKFGVSESTLEKRCVREKWNVERKQISQRVVEKVVDAIAIDATAFVQETIRRGLQYRVEIDASKQQAAAPAIDPTMLDSLSRVEVRVTDMVRKALGIPDVPQKLEVVGSLDITERILAARRRANKPNVEES